MFQISYIKDGKEYFHPYRPSNLEQALGIGHELVRDYVADYFKVTRLTRSFR